ncbi:MAG: hypothetical protein WB566_10500 [Terriglobales bacterium]
MNHPVPRRDFLKNATGLLTGIVIAGSPLALIAKGRIATGRAWAVPMSALTTSEAATLMTMARTIAPHDKLDDAAYALVVKAVDEAAVKDEHVGKTIKEGIASLGAGFAARPESDRVAVLKKIESSDFFQTMRLKTLQVLYATPMAYAYFGYEGEAFSKGGYLERGFNDLHWLPEVPLKDSGPLPA